MIINSNTNSINVVQELGTSTTAVMSQKAVTDAIANMEQSEPSFANSIEECTDTSKMYVLPDGMIYAWMLTQKEVPGGPAYTNQIPLSTDTDRKTVFNNGKGYQTGLRLSSSGGTSTSGTGIATMGSSGFIPAKDGDVLRVKNFSAASGAANYVIAYDGTNAKTGIITNPKETQPSVYVSPGYYEVTLNSASLGTSNFDAIRFCVNGFTDETIATINEAIVEGGGTEIITEYAWASTGHAFVPADYEDRIIAVENKANSNAAEIAKLKNNGVSATDTSLMFISPDGNDSNSGRSKTTPKKTVKACVNAGATRISAKRGIYNEIVQLSNIGELEIFPTDNDLTYAEGEEREPIVFDTSDSVDMSSLTAYNSIKRVAYSNAENTQFDKVFVAQSQPPVIGDGYGSRYNATVWLLSEDERTVCIKLKPVLTVAECEAETNTFSYVDRYIYINASLTGVDKIIVPTNWGTGFRIENAEKVVLCEVEVRFSGTYNLDIRNCAYFDFYKCACKYTSYASGFHPFNSNGIMTACYATKNYDGYGISGYGHTTYVDCVSEFNFDDGMSHHDGTSGTVIGGRYEGNGKGGNVPAYGAKVNIYGGLYKDNASFGVGYLWASGYEPASGMVHGAVMVGNPIGLSVNANCPVTAISCVYANNTKDKEIKGDLTEYGA